MTTALIRLHPTLPSGIRSRSHCLQNHHDLRNTGESSECGCGAVTAMAASGLPKMKLWYYPLYRSTRCMWLIKELGIEEIVEYAYLPMNLPKTSPEREEYRKKVHPHNTIPALEVEGHPPILESGAICLYLADLCGRLAPEPKERAEYYHWILYTTSTMDEAMERLFMQWWMFKPEEQDKQIVAKARADSELCLDNLERALEGKDFILGKELTAADCVVGFNVVWASVPEMNNGVLLEGRPNLKAYLARISARPALKETLAVGKEK
ncbi:hypothetical protein BaRGS_00000786 [Batillaria attramentaria]|uniref:Glutathione S-transferase n=1 Tax=Batillaria attramentaria TaxID=370345 RepID=A0ABD0M8R4_9CAEN